MRKSTLLWLALATFCGIALFYTSQKVHDSREKIARLGQAAAREEESVRVLQAEWSYLNQPRRLEKLAAEYLKLVPLKGIWFVKPENLPLRGVAAAIPSPVLREKVGEREERRTVAASASTRRFGDVIKSLGAER